jgi:hypothetical protein
MILTRLFRTLSLSVPCRCSRMWSRIICPLLLAGALGTLCFGHSANAAQICRSEQIMTSQCTWFALEELGGSKAAAAQAQREATSTLIEGCSAGEYQMVLLRGTGLSDAVVRRVRSGARTVSAIRAECAIEARRVAH